jgi:preprotein translocase subunit SecA
MFEMTPEEHAEYEAEYEPIFKKFKQQTDAEHEEVVEVGGLYVLGTERHESRRIDNQLRGRSGRQGDPGESMFYLSLEDDLMRLFASDRISSIMNRLKWPDDEPITAKIVSRAIESAQKQVEGVNFERRKNVLKYDEVMNTQRQVIYEERRKILEGRELRDDAIEMVQDAVQSTVAQYVSAETYSEEWDLDGMVLALSNIYPSQLTKQQLDGVDDAAEIEEKVLAEALQVYEAKEQEVGEETMRELERMVLLNITDNMWREHLYEMDYLEEGIHLRAYGQRDPLTEYRREAFAMFEEMKGSIRDEFVRYIYRVELVRQDEPSRPRPQRVMTSHGDAQEGSVTQAKGDKVGRNAPCPCGSGRKYKKCHGATA